MIPYFKRIDEKWHYRPLLWLVVVCIISFFTWAAFTHIHEQVRGTGRVIPAGDIRMIQHLEGGIIREILKQKGEKIKKGDVIFTIDNMRAQSEQEELQIALKSNMVKQQRLQSELDEKDMLVFSEDLEKELPQIIQSEIQLFKSRQSERAERIKGLESRMKQKVLKLDDLSTTAENLKRELSITKEQLSINNKLQSTGAISRNQYLDTLSKVKDFETRISKAEKEIPIVKSELGELTNLIEEERQKWKSEVGEEINTVQIEIKKLQERIRTIDDEVDRTDVRSPVNGLVNKLYVNTIGGVIQPGSNLAEILPVEDKLVIEGRVSTNDRGKIWLGLPVVAKISAYDYTLYGGLKGTLTYISPNSFIDNQNMEYYEIRVEIASNTLGDSMDVFPGMTADINILAGKVSILHAIMKPFSQIRHNALREK